MTLKPATSQAKFSVVSEAIKEVFHGKCAILLYNKSLYVLHFLSEVDVENWSGIILEVKNQEKKDEKFFKVGSGIEFGASDIEVIWNANNGDLLYSKN